MSIYIKGMDMPTESGAVVKIFPDGRVVNFYACDSKKAIGTAVPVPPHGQLIDLSTVDLSDGPYEYAEWVEWALEKYQDAPVFLQADYEGKSDFWKHWLPDGDWSKVDVPTHWMPLPEPPKEENHGREV